MSQTHTEPYARLQELTDEERRLHLRLSEVRALARGVRRSARAAASGERVAQPIMGGPRCGTSPTGERVYDGDEDPVCDEFVLRGAGGENMTARHLADEKFPLSPKGAADRGKILALKATLKNLEAAARHAREELKEMTRAAVLEELEARRARSSFLEVRLFPPPSGFRLHTRPPARAAVPLLAHGALRVRRVGRPGPRSVSVLRPSGEENMSREWDALKEKISAVEEEIAAADRRGRRLRDERARLIADAVTAHLDREGKLCERDGYELADGGRECPGSPTSCCIYGVADGEIEGPCFFCGAEFCDCSMCAGTRVVVNSAGQERPCDYCSCVP